MSKYHFLARIHFHRNNDVDKNNPFIIYYGEPVKIDNDSASCFAANINTAIASFCVTCA